MWSYADWDGDGDKDIVVGIDTWDDYGWDNAFDSLGRWTRGPLHGYVYLLEKHRQGICQPRQGGGCRRPDRRLRGAQSVYRRFRRRRRSGPDLRRVRRWTHLVRERRHPHGAPLRRGTAACEQTRGDPPPSGDDRPGGVGFRRRRASRPHRRRRGRPRGLGAPHGEGQKRHAAVRITRLLHPAGRSGQIRGPLDPLRLRLGRRRKTGHHCRELGRRNRFHPQPFGRRKPRVGRSAPLHRQRQAHPHPGRGERFDTGSRRTQMGLYGALRGRLGWRRTSRHHHQLDLGQNRMVPQPRRQRRAKTRPGAARARGLGGRGPPNPPGTGGRPNPARSSRNGARRPWRRTGTATG